MSIKNERKKCNKQNLICIVDLNLEITISLNTILIL